MGSDSASNPGNSLYVVVLQFFKRFRDSWSRNDSGPLAPKYLVCETVLPLPGFWNMKEFLYGRMQVVLHSRPLRSHEKAVRPLREHLLPFLRGRVLELSPKCGANLRFFRECDLWIGYEPRGCYRPRLLDSMDEFQFSTNLSAGSLSSLPFADQSVDAVAGTFVLCALDEPALLMREIKRVLKPGGRYVFIEHVASDRPGELKWQSRLAGLTRLASDGCRPDRDSATVIDEAGFSEVNYHRFRARTPIIAPHIAGVAEL